MSAITDAVAAVIAGDANLTSLLSSFDSAPANTGSPALPTAPRSSVVEPAAAPESSPTLRLIGIASVAQGASESAEAAFVALLNVDPSYRLDPLLSPKIREVFDRARRRWKL